MTYVVLNLLFLSFILTEIYARTQKADIIFFTLAFLMGCINYLFYYNIIIILLFFYSDIFYRLYLLCI